MAEQRGRFWQRSWRSAGQHRAPRIQQPDLADMGTAFGLDATFDLPPVQATAQGLTGRSTPAAESTMLESLWAINRLNGRSVI